MTDKIQSLVVGALGAGSVEVVQQAPHFDPNNVNQAVGLISQLVILIATIISLFRKKTKVEPKN
jgi:hypothetical protein